MIQGRRMSIRNRDREADIIFTTVDFIARYYTRIPRLNYLGTKDERMLQKQPAPHLNLPLTRSLTHISTRPHPHLKEPINRHDSINHLFPNTGLNYTTPHTPVLKPIPLPFPHYLTPQTWNSGTVFSSHFPGTSASGTMPETCMSGPNTLASSPSSCVAALRFFRPSW